MTNKTVWCKLGFVFHYVYIHITFLSIELKYKEVYFAHINRICKIEALEDTYKVWLQREEIVLWYRQTKN